MVRKLFWQDPYLHTLSTRIASVDGEFVTLDETIFYALSGGQESDSGSIAGRPVLEARKSGLDILYRLDPAHGLAIGDSVDVTIDFERRYRLMRLHFAAELILELTYRLIPGIEKIGAHIAADKSRIDFAHSTNISAIFPELEAQCAALIAADHPITSAFSDPDAQRRYWQVPGFARVSCGGTHLRSTGEVGALTLKRVNIGKGKERIEIRLAS